MKILLFGKQGQIGWELQRSLAPLGSVIALNRDSQGHCGDLTRPEDIRSTVQTVKPSVIVNAAAYTAVDNAEAEPGAARLINAYAPAVLAEEASRIGALLVHYSTDYVFNGEGDTPWRENDAPAPLNLYGMSKLAGENAILASGCRHLVFRTSWVYGLYGENFVQAILRLAGERKQFEVVSDQIGAPTGADLVADVTTHAIRQAAQNPSVNGLYHLAASGEISRYEYARFIIERACQLGLATRTDPNALRPISTSNFHSAALRPLNSRLDTTKLRTTFALHLPPWQDGVTRLLTQIARGRDLPAQT